MRKSAVRLLAAAAAITLGLTVEASYRTLLEEVELPAVPAPYTLHVPLRKNCEVHGAEMREQQVPVLYSLTIEVPGYRLAKNARFPHCEEHYLGGCVVGQAEHRLAWICEQCRAARSAWVAESGAGRSDPYIR